MMSSHSSSFTVAEPASHAWATGWRGIGPASSSFAGWLIDQDILWPLDDDAPWWLLTYRPGTGAVFCWLDGAHLVAYIAFVTLTLGGRAVLLAVGALWSGWLGARLISHHPARACARRARIDCLGCPVCRRGDLVDLHPFHLVRSTS